MSDKIQVFVGSSKEGLPIAERLKEILNSSGSIECTSWSDDGIFEINESTLNCLLNARCFYDYGIFVATKDDITTSRKVTKDSPRDNVVFEFGLFMGALGKERSIALVEEEIKFPSDFNGITLPIFSHQKSNLDEKLNDLSNFILANYAPRLSITPSTSLAIGYFNSFIKRLVDHIEDGEPKIDNGNITVSKVTIVLPRQLSNDIGKNAKKYYEAKGFSAGSINTPKRPFPIQYSGLSEQSGNVNIFDMPTTLSTIRLCYKHLIPSTALNISNAQRLFEQRELANFKLTLEHLCSEDIYCEELVDIIWES